MVAEVWTVMLFPRVPDISAVMVIPAPALDAVTYTPDPQPVALIAAARRVASVVVLAVLAKVCVATPPEYVHEAAEAPLSVIVSVCPFPVIVIV
jgi:hypothetical protein